MSVQWGFELLKSAGLFFLHPLFWFFIMISLAFGYVRIKRERRTFHTKIADIYDDLTFTYTKGLIPGLLLSVVLGVLGISIPLGVLAIIAVITAAAALTLRANWMSAAYIVGVSMLIGFGLQINQAEPFLERFPQGFAVVWPAMAVFLGLLVIIEGVVAYRSAHVRTSPALVVSSRGLPIGQQLANRIWLLPLFLLVPGNGLESHLSWWPVFTVPGGSFHFLWIPYFVGFGQRVQGSLPETSIRITAKRICILGLAVTALGAASLLWTPLAGAAVITALLGRVFLSIKQRVNDNAAPFYFSKRDQGLMVLGIIPNTPAEDLELKIGEIITKVNGIPVKNVSDFYEALQHNRAYVKLEIIGLNGEIRFDQRASYEGEHHELGILFVKDEREGEAAALSGS
ncbi:S1C family serine protease [Bacillus vallismortis]|uniref:S1C family serine protease n=1 Tax=Bacillus vallismortis TaxID=72361 RepID=UPI000289E9AF|nr:S1C family serine protease [Bacillus vallismortis]MBG9770419.1 cell division protein [Bacillus vallismortis]MCY7891842.1 S1C family serine protease [Bacillus vallismortis]MCY8307487.1 S1C family serine protease [Bacillus vallismortis]MCY8595419.1 S1C family serine protease [Bacillus vallismortis]MEC1267708.1 S1C family serine protease [Bacillus vallismortis]